jgi:hypothetical protein
MSKLCNKATTFWEWIHASLTELIVDYNEEKKNSKGFFFS